ncbi:MAG: hypothetical protein CMI16_12725 [Opitutaceae bacterium]|nr:hypothetical protein [Opitutaceae bacterium]|tara:strand:- start:2164 stop:3090 length:927 start_codon:yes stop_codon:yes gene_type:complete
MAQISQNKITGLEEMLPSLANLAHRAGALSAIGAGAQHALQLPDGFVVGGLLAQGTHGTIYAVTRPGDPGQYVLKVFSANPSPAVMNCMLAHAQGFSPACSALGYEYRVQKAFAEDATLGQYVEVPRVHVFVEQGGLCGYVMDRIPGSLQVLQLSQPDILTSDAAGHTLRGINTVAGDRKDLLERVASTFSYAHFKLGRDLNDCEFALLEGPPRLFLYDFDKCGIFAWELGKTLKRKHDEATCEERVIANPKKFGRFLAQAMLSMSMNPSAADLEVFVRYYGAFADGPLQLEVLQEVVEVLKMYAGVE